MAPRCRTFNQKRHITERLLNHLPYLTDTYLRGKLDYEKLKPYRDLIKDFQVVSEIAQGLSGLQDKFEELRVKLKQRELGIESSVHASQHNSSLLHSQMEKIVDLSEFI